MSDDQSTKPRPLRSPGGAMALGILSVAGLLGFAVAYGLILERAPSPPRQAATPVAAPATPPAIGQPGPAGPKGDPGPAGERGQPGAPGDAGVRVVRQACGPAECTVECADGEMLLTAYCGVGRAPAAYPTERSALCRPRGNARFELVAACAKQRPR
jgi:hypothetical protein